MEQIAFFRNLFGLMPNLLVLYLSVEWRSQGKPWKLKRWKLGFGRGLLLVAAQICFYYSLISMPLATATTLAFSGPLFVTTLSIPMLGHKVGLWRGFAVVLGFVGVVLVMQPGGEAFTPVALLPILAAFFYALTSLSSRYFEKEESTALINIYAGAGTLTTSVIVASLAGHWIPMESPIDWIWFTAMGTAGGFAVYLLIKAYRMADPSSLSPFEYFGIPFSFALGWIFFDETPFDSLFPGVLLIVAGGLMVAWRERLNQQAR